MTGAQGAALPPPTPFHLVLDFNLSRSTKFLRKCFDHTSCIQSSHISNRNIQAGAPHSTGLLWRMMWANKTIHQGFQVLISAHVQRKKKMLMVICYKESFDWHACVRVVARRVASRDASRRYWIKFLLPLSSLEHWRIARYLDFKLAPDSSGRSSRYDIEAPSRVSVWSGVKILVECVARVMVRVDVLWKEVGSLWLWQFR
jgi:hypothetical protein